MVHEKVREHIRKMEVKQNWLTRRMNLTDGALSLMLSGMKKKNTGDERTQRTVRLCQNLEKLEYL